MRAKVKGRTLEHVRPFIVVASRPDYWQVLSLNEKMWVVQL
jgi:hypothetical protein